MNKMLYTKIPKEWMEGLPVGNGRLAAMVWGDEEKDTLSLNHEWLWRGKHRNREVIPASAHLNNLRDLLKKRSFFKASLLANMYFAGDGGVSPIDNRVDPYQPAGDLYFQISGNPEFVSRGLDIEKGIVSVIRRVDGGQIVSTHLASCENELLMSQLCSEKAFSCNISLSRIVDKEAVYKLSQTDNKLIFDCEFIGGISHRVVSEIKTDGQISTTDNKFFVANASYVKCITNIATSVFSRDEELAKYPVSFLDFEADIKKHSEKFSKMMNGVSLSITEEDGLSGLSIEERIERVREGNRDNGISQLYFDFGRYLMISSSICGSLPANLQGKWNDKLIPDWDSDYHFDINLEMNYWMAEPCDLSVCTEALLKYLESFYESGKKAAKELYGCRGIYLPLQTDAWGISTPESFGWAAWVGAAPWAAQSFWHHYIYTGDIEF